MAFNFWLWWHKRKADKAMRYLIINNHDHDHFIDRYDELRGDYRDCVNQGEQMDELLIEKLRSLFDGIAYQIKEDDKYTHRFSQDIQDIIASRHVQWRAIQQEIKVMIYPVKL